MRAPSFLRAPVALMAALFLAAPPLSAAGESSIVYVDVERTIAEVDEGQAAQDAMKKEQVKRQGEIQAREAEIKRQQEELEKQAKAFSKEAIEKKAAAYQQALGEYQQMVVKYNKELGEKERELFDPIERKMKELLRTLANRDGYDMILSKRSVPYGRKDLDLTDKVIQEYNKAHPSARKPAAAGAGSAGAKKPPAPAASVAPKK